MRYFISAITVCLIHFSASGQHVIGFKADAGLSQISTNITVRPTIHRDAFSFSGHEGAYYNFLRRRRTLLGAEIIFVHIRGKEHIEDYSSGSAGDLSGNYLIEDDRRMIHYLGIPLYYGFRFKKLNVNLGFQTLFAMKSRGRINTTSGYNSVSVDYESSINQLSISGYNFGPRAGVMFTLNKNVSVEAVYYYGLNDINVNDPTQPGKWKSWRVQQFTIGIRYKAFELELEEKKINAELD